MSYEFYVKGLIVAVLSTWCLRQVTDRWFVRPVRERHQWILVFPTPLILVCAYIAFYGVFEFQRTDNPRDMLWQQVLLIFMMAGGFLSALIMVAYDLRWDGRGLTMRVLFFSRTISWDDIREMGYSRWSNTYWIADSHGRRIWFWMAQRGGVMLRQRIIRELGHDPRALLAS